MDKQRLKRYNVRFEEVKDAKSYSSRGQNSPTTPTLKLSSRPKTPSKSKGANGAEISDQERSANASTANPLINKKQRTRSAAFATKFKFIDEKDGGSSRSRKAVREHVMREFHRRERWERGGGETNPVNSQPESEGYRDQSLALMFPNAVNEPMSPEPANLSFEATEPNLPNGRASLSPSTLVTQLCRDCGEWHSQIDDPCNDLVTTVAIRNSDVQRIADPWAAVAADEVDPFNKVNFDAGPETKAIIHHYAWGMTRILDLNALGVDFHRLSFLYKVISLYDPEPYHVILGFALGSIASKTQGRHSPVAIDHKTKAIQQISRRLQDPAQAASNETIGAVISYACHEFCIFNAPSVAVHFAGLARLIKLRGGIQVIRSESMFEPVILRMDLLRAYMTISKPRYPGWRAFQSLEPIMIDISSGAQPGIDEALNDLCSDFLSLIHGLEDLVLLIGSVDPATEEWDTCPDLSIVVDAAASLLSKLTWSADERNDLKIIKTCCRLATLVFIDICLHRYFDTSEGIWGEGNRHAALFALLRDYQHWRLQLNILLQLLLKGNRVALEDPRRTWYIVEVLMLVQTVGPQTWPLIFEILCTHLLPEGASEGQQKLDYDRIWDLESMARNVISDWN